MTLHSQLKGFEVWRTMTPTQNIKGGMGSVTSYSMVLFAIGAENTKQLNEPNKCFIEITVIKLH